MFGRGSAAATGNSGAKIASKHRSLMAEIFNRRAAIINPQFPSWRESARGSVPRPLLQVLRQFLEREEGLRFRRGGRQGFGKEGFQESTRERDRGRLAIN